MVQPENFTDQDTKYEDQSTGSSSQKVDSSEKSHKFIPQATADGSYTFFSQDFQEAFHSHQGAKLEAELKFVKTTQLTQLAQQPTVRLLDVCYGLGYNTAAALTAIWQINRHCHVQWFGLELDPSVPQAAIAHQLLAQWPPTVVKLLTSLVKGAGEQGAGEQGSKGAREQGLDLSAQPNGSKGATDAQSKIQNPKSKIQNPFPFSGQLLFGDARQTIQTVQKSGFQADVIFLDPFSPISCPQLWTVEFLDWVVRCLAPTGRLTTYSCSAAARTALRMAGLTIGSTPGVGRKSPGTIANFTGDQLPPLSPKEEEHLQTRSSIPYRDPTLVATKEAITLQRRQEQAESTLETTSQWKKRWLKQEQQSVGEQ